MSRAATTGNSHGRPEEPGQVITFYSYKGGTGRTMALANLGVILSRRTDVVRPVLMIDWDLEAPGLPRYFRPGAVDEGAEFVQHPGLIDLFSDFVQAIDVRSSGLSTEDPEQLDILREDIAAEVVEGVSLGDYVQPTDVENLYLMSAGHDRGGDYAARVNSFDWAGFYGKAPTLFRSLAHRLAREYSYVLIDSRTGLTDTSGICTALMPEKLVLVFTPNEQSLQGVLVLLGRALTYRRETDDLRPLVIYPLPSRIESTEPDQLERWRLGDSHGFVGYQPRFEKALQDGYELETCSLRKYFDEVQVQHSPAYAYGEQVAARRERSGDVLSLSRSYERFVYWLAQDAAPWRVERSFESQERDPDMLEHAERVVHTMSVDERDRIRALLLRLVDVRYARDPEHFTARPFPVTGLDPAARSGLALAEKHGLVEVSRDGDVIMASGLLHWGRLRHWVAEDARFLAWRSRLGTALEQWLERDRDPSAALSGAQLQESAEQVDRSADRLHPDEVKFVRASLSARAQVRNRWIGLSAAALVLAVVGALTVLSQFRGTREQAYMAAIRADAANLRVAQELYYVTTDYRYAGDAEALDFQSTSAVSVEILHADSAGWAAVLRHERIPESCVVWDGAGPPAGLRVPIHAQAGVPFCDEIPDSVFDAVRRMDAGGPVVPPPSAELTWTAYQSPAALPLGRAFGPSSRMDAVGGFDRAAIDPLIRVLLIKLLTAPG